MNQSYKFVGGSEQQAFGPLPPGDYNFEISDVNDPYFKNDKWILSLRIVIKPHGLTVFANAWTGTTKDGDFRDGIGDLLIAVNKAPAIGTEPDFRELIGARGKCRLKIEVAQAGALEGKEVNRVAFWHKPHQLQPEVSPKNKPDPPVKEPKPEEPEPDDIPF